MFDSNSDASPLRRLVGLSQLINQSKSTSCSKSDHGPNLSGAASNAVVRLVVRVEFIISIWRWLISARPAARNCITNAQTMPRPIWPLWQSDTLLFRLCLLLKSFGSRQSGFIWQSGCRSLSCSRLRCCPCSKGLWWACNGHSECTGLGNLARSIPINRPRLTFQVNSCLSAPTDIRRLLWPKVTWSRLSWHPLPIQAFSMWPKKIRVQKLRNSRSWNMIPLCVSMLSLRKPRSSNLIIHRF